MPCYFARAAWPKWAKMFAKRIRDIGGRDKIVYVHFRDIQGTPRSFREVFIDEGQNDMHKAMQTYKDVGFNGPFMMDHTPRFWQSGY